MSCTGDGTTVQSQVPPPPSPPGPPPPPPPVRASLSPQHVQADGKSGRSVEDDLNETLNRILDSESSLSKVFYLCNTELKPQLQNGPQCGLVALSIATDVCANQVRVDDIYREAVSLGYTKQGEIFEAGYLADLAEKLCGFQATVITGGLTSHFRLILETLLEKNLILVPYDSDRNHSPCCKMGLKAHWAVVSGFAILSGDGSNLCELPFVPEPKDFERTADKDVTLKFHQSQGKGFVSTEDMMEIDPKTADKCQVYLIARHGKSRRVAVWPFGDTAESNGNLWQVATCRTGGDYVVPEGGPAKGLRGKAVILKHK